MTDTRHLSLIRIGVHKCGTTFLNSTLFPRLTHYQYPGFPPDDNPFSELVERVIDGQPYDLARCRELVAAHWRPREAERAVILSDGRLSAARKVDQATVARRLHDCVGPVHILLTIRQPEPFLQSLFTQIWDHVPADADINRWLEENWEAGLMLRRQIAFDEMVRPYVDVFGDDLVHVHLLDEMHKAPADAARFLGAVFDQDPADIEDLLRTPARNTRMSALQRRLIYHPRLFAMAKAIAGILPGPLFRLASRVSGHSQPYTPQISPEWRRRIADAAAPGLAYLAGRGVPVERFGYLERP